MVKKYARFIQENRKVNCALFVLGALVSGYFTALATEAVRHGLMGYGLWEYAIRTSFLLVSVCAVAFALLTAALAFVFRRLAVASLVMNVISCIVGVANANKILFRDAALLPIDIFLIKDAAIAAVDYDIVIGKSFYLLLMMAAALFLVLLPVKTPDWPGKSGLRRLAARAGAFAALAALSVGMIVGVFWHNNVLESLGYLFFPKTLVEESLYNTFYPSFFRAVPALFVKAPESYSEETMQQLGEDIAAYAAEANGGKEVDVIILQLESFFYPDTYDVQYDAREVFGDLLGLGAEGAMGYVVSPQTGGGTADVEFEVLTGFTSNDAQCLVNPFSIYVTGDTPNYVGYLREKGYTAVSVHSHNDTLYNRVNAYAAMGFDESVFSTEFENPEMFGGFVSEESCIDKVIEEYDAVVAQGGKALIHTVTMQNHALLPLNHYTDEELVPVTSETLSAEDVRLAQVYLTSSKDIAAQVARLAQHIKATGRDAILIVYGDHQSDLMRDEGGAEFYKVPESAACDGMSADEYLALSHRTPFYVWSSFDYEGEKDLGVIAPNAILPTALEAFGVTRPAYFDYLNHSADTFRSVTGNYVIFEDGTLTTDISEAALADNIERLLIQHDFLHGKGYLVDKMY